MPAMSTNDTVAGTSFSLLNTSASRPSRASQRDDPDVGLDRGEGVVRREHLRLGEGVEERRLADVRETDDADGECHATRLLATGDSPELWTLVAPGEGGSAKKNYR